MSFSSQRLARGLALVGVLGTFFAGRASAQTVIVRHAPAGASVEVQLNTAPATTATADDEGVATLTLNLPATLTETLVSVYVDTCGREVDVRLLSSTPAPVAANCTRSDGGAQFVIRPITTFVINVGGSGASVRMRQGPPFASWLTDTPLDADGAAIEGGVATSLRPRAGLSVFGGGGIASYSNAKSLLCGDTICNGKRFALGSEVGVMAWALPVLGLQVSYLRPAQTKASGSGTGFTFDSALDSRVLILAATVGGTSANLRFYGQGGANYHRATFTQNEQTADASQSLYLETKGWGWVAGGGIEGWVVPRLAIYFEGRILAVRGNNTTGGEGVMHDHLTTVMGGLRFKLF